MCKNSELAWLYLSLCILSQHNYIFQHFLIKSFKDTEKLKWFYSYYHQKSSINISLYYIFIYIFFSLYLSNRSSYFGSRFPRRPNRINSTFFSQKFLIWIIKYTVIPFWSKCCVCICCRCITRVVLGTVETSRQIYEWVSILNLVYLN